MADATTSKTPYHFLDVTQSSICDQCGEKLDSGHHLKKDFGKIQIPLEMKFCKTACQDKMIESMLSSPVTPHDTKHRLMIESPLITKQMRISCDQASCPHNTNKKSPATPSTGSTEATRSEPLPDQDLIEAGFISRLKQAFNTKEYFVDTENIARDIAMRVLWYSQQPGGVEKNFTAITHSGTDVVDLIAISVADLGFTERSITKRVLEEAYFAALSDEEYSKSFFPQTSEVMKPLKQPGWSDEMIAKDFASLLRRGLDVSRKPVSNKAQIALDVRKVVRSVIDKTGMIGYQFLIHFLFDVTDGGIQANMNHK